jgi:hypothetical protein
LRNSFQGRLRFQDNLDAAVFFLRKDFVSLGRLFERQPMRDDVVELNLAVLDQREQLVDIFLHRRLAECESDTFVEDLPQWKFVRNSVNPDDADEAAAANRANAILKDFGASNLCAPDVPELIGNVAIGFHAHGIDANVGAATICQLTDYLDRINLLRVDCFGVGRVARFRESILLDINADNALCAAQPRHFLRH